MGWRVGGGEWEMECDGECGMESVGWRVWDGEWGTESGGWRVWDGNLQDGHYLVLLHRRELG